MAGKHSKDQEQNFRINHSQYYKTKSKKGSESTTMKGQKKKKSNNKLNIFFKIIAFIYVIITALFYISVLRMNLLPTTYIIVLTIAEIIFTLAMVVGLGKKHKTYKLNIFCMIIVLLLSGVYIYVTNYTNATTDFLGNVFQDVIETEEYYVVVRKNSNYEQIEDIQNEDVYLFQLTEEESNQLTEQVEVNFQNSDDLIKMGEELIDGEIDIIYISASQYDILTEEIEDFENDVKILNTLKREIKSIGSMETENSKHTINGGVFNVYISGNDKNSRRSDANIIVTVNTKTHEVLLTSIPRDYYVTLHGKQAKDKLTHSGIYGINETVTTVEDLLDIDINYYVRVNFTTVKTLVDTLGGIDVYSEYEFSSYGYHYNQGYNHLDGAAALQFSRERHAFASGDNQRVKNQQAVIEAIMKKVLNSTTILTKYTSILNALEGTFQTNIEQSEISSLVKDQLNNMSSWTIKTNALTGTGASRTTYSLGSSYAYVMIPDSDSVDVAKEEIQEVMGE